MSARKQPGALLPMPANDAVDVLKWRPVMNYDRAQRGSMKSPEPMQGGCLHVFS